MAILTFKTLVRTLSVLSLLGAAAYADASSKRDADKLIKPPKDTKLNIETNKIKNIDDLIMQFRIKKSTVLAEMISEEYFEIEDYQKSLVWAVEANEIDKGNEFSWVMYAKNQAKLGNKTEAKAALNVFLSYHKDAQSALNLLGRIEAGEL